MNSVIERLDDSVLKVSGAGQFVGLEVLLRVSTAQYVAYSRSYYGINVLIHSPEDYPQASATTTVVQPGYDVILAIIPSVVVSTPDVRSLALEQRNCLFEDEVRMLIDSTKKESTGPHVNFYLEKIEDDWQV